MVQPSDGTDAPITLSVVVPVYQGEHTLDALVAELEPYLADTATPAGVPFRVSQIILVHDNGPDASDQTIRRLAARRAEVEAVWLSRNYGQHAATLAGMAASTGDWIVTMDEDGQHDPRYIPALLDAALTSRVNLVYAKPTNIAPHGAVRNLASRAAKALLRLVFSGTRSQEFQSFRLVRGAIGRRLGEVAVSGVYLDVALGWVTDRTATIPVELRREGRESSGYSYARLLAHFWRMVLSSGTRGLRLVSILGVGLAVVGVVLAAFLAISRLSGDVGVPGWTSLAVLVLLCSGAILVSLGIIAEYIGVTLNVAMGRPLYLVVDDDEPAPTRRRA